MMQIPLTLLSPHPDPLLALCPLLLLLLLLLTLLLLTLPSAAENGFKLSECLTCSNARMRAVSSLTLAFHDKSKKRSLSLHFSVT